MKGTINLVKDAVHWHFNDHQDCNYVFAARLVRHWSRGRFDVWPCILVILAVVDLTTILNFADISLL